LQIHRDLIGVTDIDVRYGLTLAAPPENGASKVLADIRAGVAECPGTFTFVLVDDMVMSESVKEIHISPLGAASIAYEDQMVDGVSGKSGTEYVAFVQVGSVVVEVRALMMPKGIDDPAKLQAQLVTVAKAQVAKLEAAAA